MHKVGSTFNDWSFFLFRLLNLNILLVGFTFTISLDNHLYKWMSTSALATCGLVTPVIPLWSLQNHQVAFEIDHISGW